MGILTRKSGSLDRGIKAFPAGCFTVDRDGHLISSTLPQNFSSELAGQIARAVLGAFEGAHQAHLIFNEIQVTFLAMKLTARELRGGAIIFLAPARLGRANTGHDTSTI